MQCPHQSLCIKQYYIWVQTSKPSAHSKNPHCFCLGSGQAKNFLPLLGPSFITVLKAAGLPWFGQIGNFSSAHCNTPKSKISCIWYNSLRYIQQSKYLVDILNIYYISPAYKLLFVSSQKSDYLYINKRPRIYFCSNINCVDFEKIQMHFFKDNRKTF